jgi:predicted ribosomally synthesized peptide with SipW-like signal peptide
MKKILLGVLSFLLAISIISSTLAYFTDVESSSNNTISMGTLGLQICDDGTWYPDDWCDGLDQTWTMGPMEPGVSYVTNDVALREVGTIAGNHVEITVSSAIDEQITPPGVNPLLADSNPASQPQDLGKWLEVTSMLYSGDDLIWRITSLDFTPGWDINGNGWLDMDDLVRSPAIAADHGPLDDLLPPNLTGGEGSFYMTVMLHSEATSDIQGDLMTLIVSFSLNHNPDQ